MHIKQRMFFGLLTYDTINVSNEICDINYITFTLIDVMRLDC